MHIKDGYLTLLEDVLGYLCYGGSVRTSFDWEKPETPVQLPRGFHESIVLVMDGLLRSLTRGEEKAIRIRYGLIGRLPGRSYEECGKLLRKQKKGRPRRARGVTKERVRQIVMKGIRRLRHPSKSRVLREVIAEYRLVTDNRRIAWKEK